jgi:DNA (cytosine-5)-methyltransferase 1
MVNYTCETCLKSFAQKGHFDSHNSRKRPCKKDTTIDTLVEKRLNELLAKQAAPAQKSKFAISLFSGAGGDTCGLEQGGWTVTHFSEFKADAVNTHKAAFPSSTFLVSPKQESDIKKIPDDVFQTLNGKADLIFAGFPCQGFSHAGKKRVNDPRNELIHDFVRVVRLVQPTWIIGENVKGLLARKGVYPEKTKPRPVISIICELFETIGYKLSYRVIDAAEIGVPQLRKRLILIGHRGSEYPHVPWEQLPKPSVRPTIRAFLTSTLEGAMELPSLYKPQDQPTRYWIPTTEMEAKGAPHKNLVRLVSGIRNLSSKEKEAKKLDKKAKVPIKEPEGLISFGVRKGGYHGQILDPDAPSKTIICTYNQCPRLFVGLYNATTNKYWIRCLTVEECGQIQGFPKDYPWQGTEKEKIIQIGNAVPPPLAKAIVGLFDKVTFHPEPQVVEQQTEEDTEEEDDENENED